MIEHHLHLYIAKREIKGCFLFLELTQLRNQLRMINKKWSSYIILLVVNFSCK